MDILCYNAAQYHPSESLALPPIHQTAGIQFMTPYNELALPPIEIQRIIQREQPMTSLHSWRKNVLAVASLVQSHMKTNKQHWPVLVDVPNGNGKSAVSKQTLNNRRRHGARCFSSPSTIHLSMRENTREPPPVCWCIAPKYLFDACVHAIRCSPNEMRMARARRRMIETLAVNAVRRDSYQRK